MLRILNIFTVVVILAVALLAFFADALSIRKQHLDKKPNKPNVFRAPKNNAKYNLTSQDMVSSSAVIGGDLYLPYPTSTFSCLALNGWQYIITRGFHSYGSVDQAAEINLNNAAVAGIAYRDVYFFPCAGMDPTAQIQEFYRRIPAETFGTMWIDWELNPSPNCGYSTTNFAQNCAFLTNLIQAAQNLSIQLGLYSSHWEWLQIFGSADACPIAAQNNLPLWYANYDNQTNFSDFIPFGGYTTANMKQFTDSTSFCNVIADQDYYPS
jgi:hypothetical protein